MAKAVWNEDGSLWNHRHELLAQNIVMGCSHKDAMAAAGLSTVEGNRSGASANCCKILNRPEVIQRMADLRAEQRDMYKMTKEKIIETLGKIVMGDESADSNKIKACDLVSKMMGYHAAKEQKLTVKTDTDSMSDAELEEYIKECK